MRGKQVYNDDAFTLNTRDIYGKIDTVNKIILISNISQETVVHELVHAATIDKVGAPTATRHPSRRKIVKLWPASKDV